MGSSLSRQQFAMGVNGHEDTESRHQGHHGGAVAIEKRYGLRGDRGAAAQVDSGHFVEYYRLSPVENAWC